MFHDFSAVRKLPYLISRCLVLLVIESRKTMKGTKRVMYTKRITESLYNSVVCYENSNGLLHGIRILEGHRVQQSSDCLRTATANIKFFCSFNCDLCLSPDINHDLPTSINLKVSLPILKLFFWYSKGGLIKTTKHFGRSLWPSCQDSKWGHH